MLIPTLHYRYGTSRYAKCEYYNSLKDRRKLYILQRKRELSGIRASDTIMDATSRNTGIAFHRQGVGPPCAQGRLALLQSIADGLFRPSCNSMNWMR